VNAFSTQLTTADRVVSAVLGFDRSVRVMQCGLFLLLMVLCRFLRNCWQQHVFGVALGFGVFASIELILVSVAMHYGSGPAATISLVKSTAYNAVTVLWILYLRREPQPMPVAEIAPQLNGLNMALLASTDGGDHDFLSMVEQAVDRVLSRSSWPRPSAKGSQILGRKPEPEERN
jgi:4-amino-4-deoxy-L-arabinose transferase-like glycosyltransferase